MKKIFCKKTLSAFLAAVMILAMIPVGMISAVAATAGTDYVLGTNTITINTVEGWKYVSANAATYADYDIILGDDLDFEDETGYGPLFNSDNVFTGSFDGEGHTISNFESDGASLIANLAAGATVCDVKISGVTLTGNCATQLASNTTRLATGVIFAVTGNAGVINISEVTIENAYIVGGGGGSAAGFIGSVNSIEGVNISKCNFEGEIYLPDAGGSGLAGGLIGECRYKKSFTGKSTISNCLVDAQIFNGNQYGFAAGIAAEWGYKYSTGLWPQNASLTINNCYIKGEYSAGKSTAINTQASPVIGKCDVGGTPEFVLENIVTDAVLAQRVATVNAEGKYVWETKDTTNTTTQMDGYLVGLVENTDASFSVTNCATTIEAAEGKSAVDETELQAEQGLTSAQIASLVSYDAEGYVNGVMGSLVGTMMAQVSNVVDDKYIIRFVMPAMTADMTDVKMTISVTSGETQIHTYEIDCTMWDSLTGYNGRTGFTTYTPDQYGAEKLLAGAIVGVPTGTAYDFAITTTFTVSGVEITSTTYGASVNAAGELVTE